MALDTRWKNPQGKDPEQLWRWAQDLITELRRGDYLPATPDASDITYDNATSGLTADNVQDALDENDGRLDALEAVPPGLVLLNSGIVTNQATLPIVLTSFTAFRALKFLLTTFVPATDDVELWLRFSTDGGANYDATGYSWTNTGGRDGSSTPFSPNATAANQISLTGLTGASENVSNVAAEGGIHCEVTLYNQANTGIWQRAGWHSRWYSANDQSFHTSGTGARETAQDTDAVQFRFESGNIASGNWALYGYA